MSIAVIVASYNSGKFIEACLSSVVEQTLPPDEIIVIDDGSTDDTVNLAESFGPRVRVIRHKKVQTFPRVRDVSTTRNLAISQARTEWVALIDGDDVWERSKLERQMEELRKHPEADGCYTGWVYLMQEGENTRLGQVHVPPAGKDMRKALFDGVVVLTSCMMLRRSTVMALGGFDSRIQFSEDYDLWLRLVNAGVKFAACPEPLMQYRRHELNTSTGLAWLADCCRTYRMRVSPFRPGWRGWLAWNVYRSDREAMAAYTLRETGDGRWMQTMLDSLRHRPLHDLHRYKVLAYGVYKSLPRAASPGLTSRITGEHHRESANKNSLP